MWINLSADKKKLYLSFRYDPKIVEAVRKITGRTWNVDRKVWELPLESASEAVSILSPLGFKPSEAVLAIVKNNQEAENLADGIRSSEENEYTGKLPLYGFQKKGACFLRTVPHTLLGDHMGLGKSLQVLGALENLPGPHLILCPASLKYSWDTEIDKWTKEKRIVINGAKDVRMNQWFYAGKMKYVIANYELLLYDLPEILKTPWNAIICDEATRISNPEAKTVKALKSVPCFKRIALTGTPVANTPVDIFSIIDWLCPRYLGSFFQFKERYCKMDPFGDVVGYKDLDVLAKKISRFMLRRTKEEVFTDFPKKTVEDIIFELPDTERRIYNGIKELIREEISKLDLDTRTLALIPVKMLRLLQSVNHTKLVGGYGRGESTKLETLKEMLRSIMKSGEKAIVFTPFAKMLHIMKEELSEFRPLFIYGDVDPMERMVKVKEFNDDPEPRIIVMTEAGTYGLNLQSASYIFHYSLPWSVSKLEQREGRAHRIGQNKPVTVYNLIAKDTIDEYILKTLHKKQRTSNEILKDDERMEKVGLSKEDIENILRI